MRNQYHNNISRTSPFVERIFKYKEIEGDDYQSLAPLRWNQGLASCRPEQDNRRLASRDLHRWRETISFSYPWRDPSLPSSVSTQQSSSHWSPTSSYFFGVFLSHTNQTNNEGRERLAVFATFASWHQLPRHLPRQRPRHSLREEVFLVNYWDGRNKCHAPQDIIWYTRDGTVKSVLFFINISHDSSHPQ